MLQRLPYSIRRSLEPTRAVRGLFGRQDINKTCTEPAELVSVFNMLIQ
jgi:hypothetical protein